MSNYSKQLEEIKKLSKSITTKSKNFTERNKNNPHYSDLAHVVATLKELDAFLK